ncbi:uncharacterized protein LOC103513102 [Diaphorina citri]|uniref:Uncharacterized protein LOC103513102 n=1 Tax=Diaphorina citri TaxID=121845 RepID=A0A3Q0J143_DIACI|nr:uncharacterized protein LOC103513102 [Diaphorina citri]
MDTRTSAPQHISNSSLDLVTVVPTLSERERIRIEFYKTYDVMTGVRIAATLGGFFGLMVILVVYKSKCKSRSLSDEHLEAAITAAVTEEEEMDTLAALNSGNFSMFGGPRRSLGNMSAPAYTRFSSFAGSKYGLIEEEEGNEGGEDEYVSNLLTIPRHSRRLSSITVSSSDTSYLERRGSALEMGLPVLPSNSRIPPRIRRAPPDVKKSSEWDFYYPIDIRVIQPTPTMSPCDSEVTLYDHPHNTPEPFSRLPSVSLTPPSPKGLEVPKLAPLASITSCSGIESEMGSDSVFLDPEVIDTEDEMEEFSLDSEAEGDLSEPRHPPSPPSTDISNGQKRRFSVPSSLQPAPPDEKRPTKCSSKNPRTVLISNPDEDQYPSCSKSCTTFQSAERNSPSSDERTLREDMSRRPKLPLPLDEDIPDTSIQRDCTVTIEEDDVPLPLVLPKHTNETQDVLSLEETSAEDESLQGRTFVHEALIEEIPVIVESKLTDDESSMSGGGSDLELRSMQNTPKLIAQKSKSDPSISEEHHGTTIMTLTLATSLSCDQLVKHLQMKEKQTLASNSIHFLPWPQETLF